MRRSSLPAASLIPLFTCGAVSQQVMRFPQGQIWGHLRATIVDRQTGRDVPARCYLTNAAGESWAPSGALTYVKPPERHFIASGRFVLELPTGTYTLRVERGTEYRPEIRQIEIRAGDILDQKIVLDRWIDMNARGWYSGDLHNHRDWPSMPEILLSEDLNLAPTLTNWIWDDRTISIVPPFAAGESAIRAVDNAHVYSILDTEIERGGPGAVDLVGLKSPVQFRGYRLSPPNTVFTEAAHRQGGYVDAEKLTWRDGPALVALGQVDFAGLVYNSFSPYGVELTGPGTPAEEPLRTMELYYRLLNCGFKLPVSAGTASGVKPTPLGYDRVYVHLSGDFSYDRWFRDLKAGRSFATNGPMLFLTVNGREPGDTVPVVPGAGKKLKIHAQAISAGNLARLEVVWKGKVIKTVASQGTDSELVLDIEQEVAETGCLAARAFETPTATMRFAQTSPVYVQAGNDRGIVPEDAKYFVNLMDANLRFYENLSGFHAEADRQAMLDMFRKARQVYADLAGI